MIDQVQLQRVEYIERHIDELLGFKVKIAIIDRSIMKERAIIKNLTIVSYEIKRTNSHKFATLNLSDGNYLFINDCIAVDYNTSRQRCACYFIDEGGDDIDKIT